MWSQVILEVAGWIESERNKNEKAQVKCMIYVVCCNDKQVMDNIMKEIFLIWAQKIIYRVPIRLIKCLSLMRGGTMQKGASVS